MLKAKVITVSDSASSGDRDDVSGPALVSMLEAKGFSVAPAVVVADGVESVVAGLASAVEGFSGLIVTTGGTGFGPRDLTPEATKSFVDREAPGLSEAMRAGSPKGFGRLSRGVCGISGSCLILNVPGSVKGSVECLELVIEVVPHILELLAGEQPH